MSVKARYLPASSSSSTIEAVLTSGQAGSSPGFNNSPNHLRRVSVNVQSNVPSMQMPVNAHAHHLPLHLHPFTSWYVDVKLNQHVHPRQSHSSSDRSRRNWDRHLCAPAAESGSSRTSTTPIALYTGKNEH